MCEVVAGAAASVSRSTSENVCSGHTALADGCSPAESENVGLGVNQASLYCIGLLHETLRTEAKRIRIEFFIVQNTPAE